MSVNLQIMQLVLIAAILSLGGGVAGQNTNTDDVCLSVRRGPEPEVIQGRPGKQGADGRVGPVGPPGPRGSCRCDLNEVAILREQVQHLSGSMI